MLIVPGLGNKICSALLNTIDRKFNGTPGRHQDHQDPKPGERGQSMGRPEKIQRELAACLAGARIGLVVGREIAANGVSRIGVVDHGHEGESPEAGELFHGAPAGVLGLGL